MKKYGLVNCFRIMLRKSTLHSKYTKHRVKKGALGQRMGVNDPTIGDSDVAYDFDGEYWNDELKDYRLFLPSRCAAVEADK